MKRQLLFEIVSIGLIALVSVGCASATPTPVLPTSIAVSPTIAPTPIPPSPTPVPAPAFNFPKGATWTYEGAVKWDAKGKTQQKTLTWKMQIADKIERGDGIVGYVMQGHPLDLAFYEEGKKPGDYLYIAKANRVYQITLLDAAPINRVKNKSDTLADLLTDDNLAFDFPLANGKKFGAAQFVADPAGMNAWIIADAKPTTLTGIKGITPANVTEYALDFKTNPDRQMVYYVPNVGITRFTYHHNGTVSEVDVKLIEYSAGASSAATGECELVVSKEITVYTRPSLQATVFGKLPAGERTSVSATTADGWLGFDPGVAQAANVGPFRLRWVQGKDVQSNGSTEGACGNLPVVASLPPTACFQMFMEDTKVYSQANSTSPIVVTAKSEDYAQIIAANDKWLQLDLNVGSLKTNKQGWIVRTDANFNGACDTLRVPAAKP